MYSDTSRQTDTVLYWLKGQKVTLNIGWSKKASLGWYFCKALKVETEPMTILEKGHQGRRQTTFRTSGVLPKQPGEQQDMVGGEQ